MVALLTHTTTKELERNDDKTGRNSHVDPDQKNSFRTRWEKEKGVLRGEHTCDVWLGKRSKTRSKEKKGEYYCQ